jgi:hypothetical protein
MGVFEITLWINQHLFTIVLQIGLVCGVAYGSYKLYQWMRKRDHQKKAEGIVRSNEEFQRELQKLKEKYNE